MPNKVVVRYLDGEVKRGYTTDFQPGKDVFHLVVKEDGGDRSIAVKMAALKAVFFVKELGGLDKSRPVVKRTFDQVKDQKLIGKKVKVEFVDGEVLYGLTLGYSPQRRGFFFTPIDPESNNERIFAVLSAVKDIRFYE
ncbi:MAG TPA: hypothetical protein ENI34_02455 [candidate division WOR-3 bacterium]|uniref:Uncharacterized protein n=1 Tax=candidate division WOR-3 bacterium TaxID=2052148 RepID=A0A9C9EKY9_UNCW3|nr:hypothetical protein [candidate division WOR-3 bacterium]